MKHIRANVKHITENYFDQTVATLRQLLRFNTVKAAAAENAPFGQGNAQCLEFALQTANQLGFKTVNCNNYAGHLEYGGGSETVGVLGHLDVVPAEGDWTVPPFSGQIKNGFLYGRGTVDDKGPMTACLYALKALKDEGFKPKKKIKIILGCDEESGGACIKHYAEKMGMPETGFSPDGDFPVINREKGLYHFVLNLGRVDKNILSLTAGARMNIVPDKATAEINAVPLCRTAVSKCQVDVKESGGTITLTATGTACHGSYPQKGDNAAWKIIKALHLIFPQDEVISFAADKLCQDVNGSAWGIPFEDKESGKLTHNLGTARLTNGELCLGIDIRYPVTLGESTLEAALKETLPQGAVVTKDHSLPAINVSEDSELVQKLLKAYAAVTGKKAYTVAVGGATFARSLPQGVAYGPMFPGEQNVIHCVNERISLARLKQIMQIYYEAIKSLAE